MGEWGARLDPKDAIWRYTYAQGVSFGCKTINWAPIDAANPYAVFGKFWVAFEVLRSAGSSRHSQQ